MSTTTDTSITASPNTPEFTDRMVDNEGFFETMEERLSPILSVHEIAANTRRELHELLAQMKKQTFIDGVTEWTAEEQKKFFARVQSEMYRVGTSFKATIQALIEDEILREIDDNGRKMKFKKNMELLDGDGNIILPDIKKYPQFLAESFLSQEDTSIMPFDLRLTISEMETVEDAQKKLDRYQGKYNALILMNESNQPMGIVSEEIIERHKEGWNTSLAGIDHIPSTVSGDYKTSAEAIKASMLEHGINIFPIIDTKSGMLIGIVTSRSLLQKELRYHSTVDLTGLRLEMVLPQAKWISKF